MSKTQNATKKTLDTQHLSKIQEFQERENVVTKLQEEVEILNNQIQEMKAKDMTDSEFDKYMTFCDRLSDMKKNLEKLERQDEEIDYYINTAPILFQYYDILENGKDSNAVAKPSGNGNSILKYFVPNTQQKQPENIEAAPVLDRATLLEKYMNVTDPNYIKQVESECRDKCPHCESTDRNVMINDGLIYCNNCSTVEYIIIDHERPSYKDPPKEMDPLKDWIHPKFELKINVRSLKVPVQCGVLVASAA
jgi:hypothetical protein